MNVIVTGASRGLGKEIALAFGRAGHNVLVNCRTQRARAATVVSTLIAMGVEAEVFPADISRRTEAEALVHCAVKKWGRIDGLVNNAGVARDRTILKMSESEWRDVIDVNLTGTFWCLKAAAEQMTRQKDGFIINMASIVGVRGGIGCANYAAAKAGVLGLTKAAAKELGRFNIRVNAVLPGFHPTDMAAAIPEKVVQKVREEHVLPQLPDREELGRFVVFLANQKSVSGQVYSFESRVL